MNKEAFLNELKSGLSGLPEKDVEERVSFYSEMIDDRVEEGMSEEEAVAGIGSVSELAAQHIPEAPPVKPVGEKITTTHAWQAWEIVLLVLGFPLWFSLLVAAAAVVLALYVVIWSVIVSLWAVWLSVAVCVLGGAAAGAAYCAQGRAATGILLLGMASFGAGVAILGFFGCVAASKGVVLLTKHIALWVKRKCTRKENAQ